MTANSADTERRQFYRIDDYVRLTVRPVEGEEGLEDLVARIEGEREDRFTLAATFLAQSREMNLMLRNAGRQPDSLVRYLRTLDDKLNTLARLLMEDRCQDEPGYAVNLSAGGMSFASTQAMDPDQIVEVRMVLLPEEVGILAAGRVVECHRQEGEGPPFRVGLEYAHIREADRDLLVKHVLDQQRQRCREK